MPSFASKSFRMAKSQSSSLQMQFVESWMATRPYEQASTYDTEYIIVGHAVLDMLMDQGDFFSSFGLGKPELVHLSTTLVSYFEDFINETGFFRAFVEHNHEVTGRYLPFYVISSDYDPDYLNPEDLSFLVWHWLMKTFGGKKMFAPTANVLLRIGKELVEIFEEFIEDMPANEAYDALLEVSDDDSIFKIRHVMDWVASKHYFFGKLGFEPLIVATVRRELGSLTREDALRNGRFIAADTHIGCLYSTRSRLGGLTPCEWTARILRCSDTVKSRLNAIRPRYGGYFVYMGQDQRNYFFHHHPTGRKVDVSIASMDIDAQPGDPLFLNIIRWGDEIWAQGNSRTGFRLSDIKVSPVKTIPELLLTPEERERWLEAPRFHERKFLEVFGTHVVIFPTATEAFAATDKVYRAITDEVSGKSAASLPPARFDGFEPDQPLALTFIPGQGIIYCPYTPVIVGHLQSPGSSGLDSTQVTNTLFKFVHPFVVAYILQHYPTVSLGWPGMSIDPVRDAQFLSTYFLPEESGSRVPLISFVDRG